MYTEAKTQQSMDRGYAGQAGSAGNQAGTMERQAEIPALVQRLDNRLAQLGDAIGALDSRLTGNIARSCPPMPTSEGKN